MRLKEWAAAAPTKRVVLRAGHVSLETSPATTSPPAIDHRTNQLIPLENED